MTIFLWQPIDEITILNLRETFLNYFFYFMFLLALTEFLMTVPFFLQTDLFGLNRMKSVITNDHIEYPSPVKISVPPVYRTCRHPMQSGIMGIFIFSSGLYNLGRFLLVVLFLVGIYIGVNQEEKLLRKSDGYVNYSKIVKNQFIPEVKNLWDKEVINAIENNKNN